MGLPLQRGRMLGSESRRAAVNALLEWLPGASALSLCGLDPRYSPDMPDDTPVFRL